MMKNITFSINFLYIFFKLKFFFLNVVEVERGVGIKIFVLFLFNYITYVTFSAIKVKVVDNNWFT